MRNRKRQPICGINIDPLGPRTLRPRRVWAHRHCQRVVKNEGDRCWQHRRAVEAP